MNPNNPNIAAIIVAAGSSKRMAVSLPDGNLPDGKSPGGVKKEYRILSGSGSLTVLGSAARAFAACKRISQIIIVIPKGHEKMARASLPGNLPAEKEIVFVQGGASRQASAYNALCRLEKNQPVEQPAFALIHDGARPWIKIELIERIIDAVILHKAVIPYLPVSETPKEMDFTEPDPAHNANFQSSGFISRHLKRSRLGLAQTPQAFDFLGILKAHKMAIDKMAAQKKSTAGEYTDDAEVWGEFIGKVAVIPGDPENRKITFPEDLR